MPAHKFEQFGGMLPAWDDHLLPPGQAAASLNGYLFGGALTGWRQPKLLRSLTNSAAKFVYRLPTVTKVKANAYLLFFQQPNAFDQISVGEVTYTFQSVVSNAYDVLIGANSVATSENLLAALTADFGADTNQGTLYGNGTQPNNIVSQVQGDNSTLSVDFGSGPLALTKVVAPDYGPQYNTVIVTESTSGARMTWLSSLLSSANRTTTFTGGVAPTFDSTITGTSEWLEFLDPDTNVVRSPVVNDQYERYYFASPSLPPEYNTRARIDAGLPPWLLGIPAPGCAPIISVTGGGDSGTLGDTTSGGSTVAVSANSMYLVPVTPDGSMSLSDIQVGLASGFTGNMVGVLYADLNGVPGQFIAQTPFFVNPSPTNGLFVMSFVNTPGLNNGVKYWIGFATDTVCMITVGGLGGNTSATLSNPFSNGPPEDANGATLNQTNLQMYGDITTSNLFEARSYVYTYYSAYQEEGPPSPPTIVNGWANGVWTIGLFQPPPDDQGVLRNITQIRIYRTVSAQGGQTTFFHVADVPVGTATYTDTSDDQVVALNNQMASTNWFPPPFNLDGFVSMPNGMIAGFVNNEIWFCEPYRPHAWPPGYVLTTDFPIVGLGVVGNSVVAATSAYPYVANGVSPAVATLTKVTIPEPCLSRGSILGTPGGVYYMSPNGLIQVTESGAGSNMTEMWITRERWRALTPQKFTRAVLTVSCYFCFGTTNGSDASVAQQGFYIELSTDDAKSFSIWPQPGGHRIGFNQLNAPNSFNVDNVITDPWTGVTLLVQNGAVYYYDFTDANPTIIPYTWRSKILHQTTRHNFSAMKFYFTLPPGIPAQNATPNTAATTDASWNTLQSGQYAIVRVFADGNLVTCREVRTNGLLLRILSGFKAEQWQWEVTSRVNISNFQVATSAKELAQV